MLMDDLVTHDDGSYSLCFDDFGVHAALLEERGLEGGGYTWHAIVESLVRFHTPQLQDRVKYDPEGSMFVAYGTDRDALLAVDELIRRAQNDASLVIKAIEHANPDLLE
jgi:hypothetical protein